MTTFNKQLLERSTMIRNESVIHTDGSANKCILKMDTHIMEISTMTTFNTHSMERLTPTGWFRWQNKDTKLNRKGRSVNNKKKIRKVDY